MEAETTLFLADGTHYAFPHEAHELLEILDHARRFGDMAGLELSCGCCVWINPEQVTALRPS